MIRKLRFFDYKLWISIALVGLVAFSAYNAIKTIEARDRALILAQNALDAQHQTRIRAEHQTSELNAKIDDLSTQLDETTQKLEAADQSVRLLEREIIQLREQVIRLGGDPVVIEVEDNSESGSQEPASAEEPEPKQTEINEPEPEETQDPTITKTDTCERRHPKTGECKDKPKNDKAQKKETVL